MASVVGSILNLPHLRSVCLCHSGIPSRSITHAHTLAYIGTHMFRMASPLSICHMDDGGENDSNDGRHTSLPSMEPFQSVGGRSQAGYTTEHHFGLVMEQTGVQKPRY